MMGFSEKRVIMAVWLFFVGFFIISMFNADRVYHALSGKSYAVKLPADLPLHANGDLQMSDVFDYTPVNNKFEEGKGLRGQFITVANESGNAKVRVFLRSPDALYEVIENRRSFWAHSTKIAVNFFASTSGLENGIYNVGLYLSDDEGERFVWMNSLFEKVAGGPVEYIARPVALAPNGVSKDLKFAIEQIYNDNKEFVFQGWAVLENAEMSNYNAYITIKDSDDVSKTFYAPLFTRMDVASIYEDTRAANSGFRIKVPQYEFVPGKHNIKVIIKSRKTGEVIESVQTETRALNLTLTDLSTIASITPPAQESPVVKIAIDANHIIGKYQKIMGWLYIENEQIKGQKRG
jgi:hypothetical protein